MGKFDEALADCNAALAKYAEPLYTLTSRANAYLGKGNLDAALDDYDQVLRINPNYVRAYVGRGQLFEKRRDPRRGACRLSPAASACAGQASKTLTPRWRAALPGSGWRRCWLGRTSRLRAKRRRRASGSAQGGADHRQRRLQECAAAGQSAARRQADCVDLSRTRLCHRDASARSHPRQILCGPARIRPGGRKGGLGGRLLCRSRHGNRRRELPDPGRCQAGGRP